jgi:hypothetical protein
VARAKQTARSEARRRHRLANRLDDEAAPNELGGDDASAGDTAAAAAAGARRPTPAGRAAAPPRPGVLSAFRGAYHPAHIREDLRDLPRLLIGRAFLGAIALIIAGAVVFVLFPGYNGAQFLFQTLTYPPAMAPIFVVGFFATSASYLLGFIVGLVDAAILGILIASGAIGAATDPNAIPSFLGGALFTGAVTGAVFAAAAAWYRRFLSLSSPKRAGAATGANRGTRAKSASRR